MASRSEQQPSAAKRLAGNPVKLMAIAIAVLVLAALAVFLLSQDKSSDTTGKPGVRGNTATEKAPTTATDRTGTLTAGGKALLSVPRGGLAKLEGETVTGRAVFVQTTAKGGVWIGNSPSERVFVASSSSPQPGVGDRVDVTGKIRAVPAGAEKKFGLTGEGVRQLGLQGGYVQGTVKPSS